MLTAFWHVVCILQIHTNNLNKKNCLMELISPNLLYGQLLKHWVWTYISLKLKSTRNNSWLWVYPFWTSLCTLRFIRRTYYIVLFLSAVQDSNPIKSCLRSFNHYSLYCYAQEIICCILIISFQYWRYIYFVQVLWLVKFSL